MERTIVLFASGTSGTGSMRRLHCKLLNKPKEDTRFVEQFILDGEPQKIPTATIPCDGGMYLFNLPPQFNKAQPLNSHKFIVNFRDPRDRLCNQFHWEFVHPKPHLSQEQLSAHKDKVREEGIDAWVLRNIDTRYYDNFWWLLSQPDIDFCVQSYARLCLNFDSYVSRSCEFLNIPYTHEIKRLLSDEAPNQLTQNSKWIGNIWAGSDNSPGRFKHELRAETIVKLNHAFEDTLANMKKYDPDFAMTYD